MGYILWFFFQVDVYRKCAAPLLYIYKEHLDQMISRCECTCMPLSSLQCISSVNRRPLKSAWYTRLFVIKIKILYQQWSRIREPSAAYCSNMCKGSKTYTLTHNCFWEKRDARKEFVSSAFVFLKPQGTETVGIFKAYYLKVSFFGIVKEFIIRRVPFFCISFMNTCCHSNNWQCLAVKIVVLLLVL